MAIDLGGPSPLHLGVTSRPGDTRPASALDTWFKDCTSDDAEDGSEFAAAIFNEWLGWMRKVARTNGNTGLGNPVIPEVVNNDDLLIDSLRHMVQRGLHSYAADIGTANAVVVTLSPPLAEYKAGGKPIWIKKSAAANSNTTPTVDIDGLGAKTIVRTDGVALDAGELPANTPFAVVYDGTNMRLTSPPRSATKTEVEAGVLSGAFVSPATLFNKRSPYFFATGSTPQSITDAGTDKKVTNLDTLGSSYFNSGSGYTNDEFTCGAKDAGAWLFLGYAAYEILTAPSSNSVRMAIARNGVTGPFASHHIGATGTYGCNVSLPLIVNNGDVIDLRTFHNTGASRNIVSTQLVGIRLSGSV